MHESHTASGETHESHLVSARFNGPGQDSSLCGSIFPSPPNRWAAVGWHPGCPSLSHPNVQPKRGKRSPVPPSTWLGGDEVAMRGCPQPWRAPGALVPAALSMLCPPAPAALCTYSPTF